MAPVSYPEGTICVLTKEPERPAFKRPELSWVGNWEYTGAKENKSFDCEYPTTNANYNRVLDPLPFPKDIENVIAWAGAFLDRIAHMNSDHKKSAGDEIARLYNEKERYRTLAEDRLKTINTNKDNDVKNKVKITDLEHQLQASKKANAEMKKSMDQQAADYKRQIEEWIAEDIRDNAEIKSLKKLIKKAENAKAVAEADLRKVQVEIAAKAARIEHLTAEVARLKKTITDHVAKIHKRDAEIQTTKKMLQEVKLDYEQAKETINTLRAELGAANAEAARASEEYVKAVEELKIKTAEWQKENDKLALENKTTTAERDDLKKQNESLTTKIAQVQEEADEASDAAAAADVLAEHYKQQIENAKEEHVDEDQDRDRQHIMEKEEWAKTLNGLKRQHEADQIEWDDRVKDAERRLKAAKDEWEAKQKDMEDTFNKKEFELNDEIQDQKRKVAKEKAEVVRLENCLSGMHKSKPKSGPQVTVTPVKAGGF